MGTKIGWTDETWNVNTGCSRVSPGCENCYAEVLSNRIYAMGNKAYEGVTRKTKGGRIVWTGEINEISSRLAVPLRWRKSRLVFVNSMSDLFHENNSFRYIAAVFGVMARAWDHTFQVLTKRPERMVEFLEWLTKAPHVLSDVCTMIQPKQVQRCFCEAREHGVDKRLLSMDGSRHIRWPLENVWVGVSAENQEMADTRIPILRRCDVASGLSASAWTTFVSYEPALEAVDFSDHITPALVTWDHRFLHHPNPEIRHIGGQWQMGVDWIIVGGESGGNARPFEVRWARDLIRQCKSKHTAVFVKQMGSNPVLVDEEEREGWGPGVRISGHALNAGPAVVRCSNRAGADPDEWPKNLRVQQFPRTRVNRDEDVLGELVRTTD